MDANLENEKLFLEEILKGNLIVKETGEIQNAKTGHIFKVKSGQYKTISYRINGNKKCILAHRLVWITYKGLISDPTIEINHKQGLKEDNSLHNLEPLSPSENVRHAYSIGLIKPRGLDSKHGRSKLTSENVSTIRSTFPDSDLTLTEYASMYSVAVSTMYSLLVSNTWKTVVTGYEDKCKQKLLHNRKTMNQTRCSQSGRFV